MRALLFLAAFFLPILYVFARLGLSIEVDGYVLWVLAYTALQAAASAAGALAVGLLLLPAFHRLPPLRPLALVPFFAPAISTVDALVRIHGDVMYGPMGVVIAHTAYYGPYAAMLLEARLRTVPADLAEAAELYARPLTRARVLLAELRPAAAVAFATSFVFSFNSFTTPLLLGGRYPTLEVLIYLYATSFAAAGAAVGLASLALASSLALALVIYRLPALPPSEPRPALHRFGPWATAASLAALGYYGYLALQIFAPLLSPPPGALQQALLPLARGAAVALFSSTAAVAAALALLAPDLAGSRSSYAAYSASLAASRTLFGMGLFLLAQPLYDTLALLAAAHALVLTPLAYSVLKTAVDGLRQDAREACVAYLGPDRCLWRMVTEAVGPAVVQAWLVSAAASLADLPLALLLAPSATLAAVAARLLGSRGPDLVELGQFYASLLAAATLAVLAASRAVRTRPYA